MEAWENLKPKKKKLRNRYRKSQIRLAVWRSMASRMRALLDRLRQAYEDHVTDAEGLSCFLILCPDQVLKTMIRRTLDEFHTADRDTSDQRLNLLDDDDDDDDTVQNRHGTQSQDLMRLKVDEVLNIAIDVNSEEMKTSELKIKLQEGANELRNLRLQYDSDRSALQTLESRYREINNQMMFPCHRYEKYDDAIQRAVGFSADGNTLEEPVAPSVTTRKNSRSTRHRSEAYEQIAARYQRV